MKELRHVDEESRQSSATTALRGTLCTRIVNKLAVLMRPDGFNSQYLFTLIGI